MVTKHSVNSLTPRSEWHVTSPYYIHTEFSKQLGNENTQTYQVEVVILI